MGKHSMTLAQRLWVKRHRRKGHTVTAAKGADRFVLTCSCGATYLITK
jgi:hypothetical protein